MFGEPLHNIEDELATSALLKMGPCGGSVATRGLGVKAMRGPWRAAMYRHPVVAGLLSIGLVVAGLGLDLASPTSAAPGTVSAQNQGPFTFNFDSPLSKAPGILQAGATDTDPNGSAPCCAASLVTPPTQGSVTVDANGSFFYLPQVGYLGSVSFTFSLTDSDGNVSAPATVTLTDSPSVSQAPQTLVITSVPDSPYVGGPEYQVTAESTSGLGFYLEVYGTESVCEVLPTLTGWGVDFTAPGTCTILAEATENAQWAPADAEQTFTVRVAQSVTFTSTPPAQPTVGTSYPVAATAASGDPVTFSIDPGSAPICSVNGTVVSFTETGDCLILAQTAGDATYGPGSAFEALQVVGAPQTVSFSSLAPPEGVVGGQTYAPVARASSGLPVSFVTYGFSGDTTIPVCYMSGSVLVFWAVGTCEIVAVQTGNDIYARATAEQTFGVDHASDRDSPDYLVAV